MNVFPRPSRREMKRNLDLLAQESFDVVVVGGGILGAFVTLLAARMGLRTALLEKGDFASGTTSGSGKVVHGGIRYLQEFRLSMARRAQREQAALGEIAPGLMRPLPFFVPCKTGDLRELLILQAGAAAWNAFRRIAGSDTPLPDARFADPEETRSIGEGLNTSLGGGLLFFDVQLRSPERLTFEIVRAATLHGAVVANYAEVVNLQVAEGRLNGVEIRDRIGGRELEVQGWHVVNAAGAWAPDLAETATQRFPDVAFGRGIHVVLDRPEPAVALALSYSGQSSADPTGDDQRRVFVMPWEGKTLVGASYTPFRGDPDQSGVSRCEAVSFIGSLADQWPGLELTDCEILYAYSGLYPVFGRRRISAGRYAASPHPLIVDHGSTTGPRGLISVMSVKLTTARHLARKIVAIILEKRDSKNDLVSNLSDWTPSRERVLGEIAESRWGGLGSVSDLPAVAEHAARSEMARTLNDVLFRRSWIGHLGYPGRQRLEEALFAMSHHFGWTEAEERRQLESVEAVYSQLGADDRADSVAAPPETTVDDETPK